MAMPLIVRDIYIAKNEPVRAIDAVFGTNVVTIQLNIQDMSLEGYSARVSARMKYSDTVYENEQSNVSISGNSIIFNPQRGLFHPGLNYLQVQLSKGEDIAISFRVPVSCDQNLFEGGDIVDAREIDSVRKQIEDLYSETKACRDDAVLYFESNLDETLKEKGKIPDSKVVGDYIRETAYSRTLWKVLSNCIRGVLDKGSVSIGKQYRVVTEDAIFCEYPIHVYVSKGFRVAYHKITDGGYVGSAWHSDYFVIPKNTRFRVVIAREESEENLSEIADIDEFVNAVPIRIGTDVEKTPYYTFMNGKVLGINHGASGSEYPSNTLQAIQKSKQREFDLVEVDVHFTADNIPVLMHDSSINRTCLNLDGTAIESAVNVEDVLYEELKNYSVGSLTQYEKFGVIKIPTLEQAVSLCKSIGIGIVFDIKSGATNEQLGLLAKIVKKYAYIHSVIFLAGQIEILRELVAVEPEAFVMQYETTGNDSTFRLLNELHTGANIVGFECYVSNLTSEKIDAVQENNLVIGVYNVKTEDEVSGIDRRVFGVTADYYNASEIIYGMEIGEDIEDKKRAYNFFNKTVVESTEKPEKLYASYIKNSGAGVSGSEVWASVRGNDKTDGTWDGYMPYVLKGSTVALYDDRYDCVGAMYTEPRISPETLIAGTYQNYTARKRIYTVPCDGYIYYGFRFASAAKIDNDERDRILQEMVYNVKQYDFNKVGIKYPIATDNDAGVVTIGQINDLIDAKVGELEPLAMSILEGL